MQVSREMRQWDFLTVEKMIMHLSTTSQGRHQGITEHLIFVNAGKSFSSFYLSGEDISDEIDQWLTNTTVLHAEPIKKELTFLLLIISPDFFQSRTHSYCRSTRMT